MLRFEGLGKYDFAVYIDGEADAIGKAGMLMGEAWFLPRASLQDGLGESCTWGKTMSEAVRAWAMTQQRRRQARRVIAEEMAWAALLPGFDDDEEEEEESENGVFTESGG